MKKLLPLSLLLFALTKNSYGQCTVTTGTVSPLTYCPGTIIAVPWTVAGPSCPITATATLYLSDSTGNFTSKVNITSSGDVTSPIIGMIPLITPAGTAYRVRVEYGDVVTTDDNEEDITIYALPTITASPSNITILSNEQAQLTAMGAINYSWSPITNLSSGIGGYVTFTPPAPGNYTFTVTGIDANGCEGIATIEVDVNDENLGINTTKLFNSINVYPNPYRGMTQITFTNVSASYTQLEVYNMLGQKVQILANEKLTAGEYKYNFSAKQIGQQAGIYFVRLSVDGKASIARVAELE